MVRAHSRPPHSSISGFSDSASSRCGKKWCWCGRRDLNPHRPCGPTDFLTATAFAAPQRGACRRFVVWTIPSPFPRNSRGAGAARLVSTPSRRSYPGLARDCHFEGSPTLSSSASPVSQASTQFLELSPVRLPIPPRPRDPFNLTACSDSLAPRLCRAAPAGRMALRLRRFLLRLHDVDGGGE